MSNRRTVVVLFVLALALRAVAALALGIDGPPVEDERGYRLLTQSVATGDGLRLPLPEHLDGPDRRAFRAPLVPLVFAPIAMVGGDVVAMRLLNLLLGALGAPLLFLALRGGTLHARAPPRVALLAALAYAAWPPHLYLSLRALSEPLSQALLLGSIVALHAFQRRHSGPLAGVLAGLSVLARPSALIPALAVALVAGGRRRGVLYALALLATLVPWSLRNVMVVGTPALTTNSGVTLVGGNSQSAFDAPWPGKWKAPAAVYATVDDAPDLDMWGWSRLGETASDARFRSDALTWGTADLGRLAELTFHKLLRLFDPDPHSSKPDAATKARIGWLSLGPVLLLALLGLLRACREPRRWGTWIALLAGTVVTALMFYGDTRMRTCADPALLALAAAGLVSLPVPWRKSTDVDGSG